MKRAAWGQRKRIMYDTMSGGAFLVFLLLFLLLEIIIWLELTFRSEHTAWLSFILLVPS